MSENQGQPEKPKAEGSPLGCVVILIVAALCWYFFSPSEKPKSDEPERVEWHRAESMAEVANRIKIRLADELAALGLDASNIVANAKAHPTRLRAGVPEHTRSRWLVLSTNDEAVISKKLVAKYKAKCRFNENPVKIARVRKIMNRLVAVVPEIDSVPEIHILKDDSVNACCLPDGTVFVNDGTLEKIPDDSLLAAILAHELGHAAARHGNECVTYGLIGAAGGVVFEEWAAGLDPDLDSGFGVFLIRIAYGLVSDAGFHLPRSRTFESEADRLGMRYLARAGFDPEAMARLFEWFEKIAPQDSDAFMQLFSTHPLHAERLTHMRKVLREPDLREMPKKTWRDKLKKHVDEKDFTKASDAVLDRLSRLPQKPELPNGNKTE